MKERRKLSRKILTVLLAVVLLVTGMAVSVSAALRITIRDGKVYQNNKPVTNKIVGSKAKGYYYVDKTGRKVNTREIRQAVDFVMRNSKAGDSRAKRLKACYRALQTYPYFGMTNRAPKAKGRYTARSFAIAVLCPVYVYQTMWRLLLLCIYDGIYCACTRL